MNSRLTPPPHTPSAPQVDADGDARVADGADQELTSRTVNSLLWLLSSNAVSSVARLMFVPILARLFAPEVFGIAAAASVVSGFAYILTTVGIDPVLVRLPHLEDRHRRTGQAISLGVGILAGTIAFSIAPWVADFFDNEALVAVLRVQALLFPLRGASTVAGSLLSRELNFRYVAFAETVGYVVGYGLVAIAGGLAGWGIWAIVAGVLCNEFLRAGLTIARKASSLKIGFDLRTAGELLRDASGFTAMRTLSYVGSQVDYMIVGRLLGLDVLGLYTKSYELISRPVSTLASTISRPLFASLVTIQQEQARVRRVFLRGMRILSLAVLPVLPVGMILSPEIIGVVLGDQWLAVIEPFRVLTLALFFLLAERTMVVVLQARGVLLRGTVYMFFAIVSIALGTYVGHYWGIMGVAVGVTTAVGLNCVYITTLVLRNLHMGWSQYLAVYGRSAMVAAVVALLIWGISAWLRIYEQPLLTLLGTLGAVGFAGLLGLWLAPRWILGQEADFFQERWHILKSSIVRRWTKV